VHPVDAYSRNKQATMFFENTILQHVINDAVQFAATNFFIVGQKFSIIYPLGFWLLLSSNTKHQYFIIIDLTTYFPFHCPRNRLGLQKVSKNARWYINCRHV